MAIVISFLFYEKTKKIFYLFFFIALLGGIARIYVGVHYPFDILFAIFIGFISSYIIYKISNKLISINKYILDIESKIYKLFI
jgi:undecaprenyl-diphosphatase